MADNCSCVTSAEAAFAVEQVTMARVAPPIDSLQVKVAGVGVRLRKTTRDEVRQKCVELIDHLAETASCHLHRYVTRVNAETHQRLSLSRVRNAVPSPFYRGMNRSISLFWLQPLRDAWL